MSRWGLKTGRDDTMRAVDLDPVRLGVPDVPVALSEGHLPCLACGVAVAASSTGIVVVEATGREGQLPRPERPDGRQVGVLRTEFLRCPACSNRLEWRTSCSMPTRGSATGWGMRRRSTNWSAPCSPSRLWATPSRRRARGGRALAHPAPDRVRRCCPLARSVRSRRGSGRRARNVLASSLGARPPRAAPAATRGLCRRAAGPSRRQCTTRSPLPARARPRRLGGPRWVPGLRRRSRDPASGSGGGARWPAGGPTGGMATADCCQPLRPLPGPARTGSAAMSAPSAPTP